MKQLLFLLLVAIGVGACKSPGANQPPVVPPKPTPPVKEWEPKFIIDKEGLHDGTTLGVQPGDTVGIRAGEYRFFRFRNFKGTAQKPIVFVNFKGLVRVNSSEVNQSNVSFNASEHFVFIGNGDKAIPYGFKIAATPRDVSALVIAGKSTDVEIAYVEIDSAGFAGIMAKTDPSANDPSTWRDAFVMRNVKIHHNYVHNVRGEGLYIGNSFWNNGMGNGARFPHEIEGLEIHHNLIERTGCEGIQYACAANSKVHDNKIRITGLSPFTPDQDNGVQIGGGVSGEFYNNEIEDAADIGLIIVGHRGPVVVRNNLIRRSGSCGVFVDERRGTLSDVDITFTNVTIDGAGEDGLRLYNQHQRNKVSQSVIRNFKRFMIDRSPRTVPLTELDNFSGEGDAPLGIGYQPGN